MTGLKFRIIPRVDVAWECASKGESVLIANGYSVSGADELCFLDVSDSPANKTVLTDVISQVAESCFISITAGGGIRGIEDVGNLLCAGADKVLINSVGAASSEFIAACADRYGSERIVASVDCRAVNGA